MNQSEDVSKEFGRNGHLTEIIIKIFFSRIYSEHVFGV